MENYSWEVTFNLPNNEKEVVKTFVEDTNTKSDLSDINFTFQDFTEEHKQKLSDSAKNRHVACSEEKKKKLSQNYPNKRKVYCEELDMIFESVQECGRYINAPATNISKVCNGRGKTVKGYHLKYYNDTINA